MFSWRTSGLSLQSVDGRLFTRSLDPPGRLLEPQALSRKTREDRSRPQDRPVDDREEHDALVTRGQRVEVAPRLPQHLAGRRHWITGSDRASGELRWASPAERRVDDPAVVRLGQAGKVRRIVFEVLIVGEGPAVSAH